MKNRILVTWFRIDSPLFTLPLILSCVGLLMAVPVYGAGAIKPNVLFIAVDDLRTALGCYGDTFAKTPALDALARAGVRFDRAYCQYTLCNPSRASLLTGRYPSRTRVTNNDTWFRDTIPDAVTLPEHFRAHGYVTARTGKILHGGLEDAKSWEIGAEPRTRSPAVSANRRAQQRQTMKRAGMALDRPWLAREDDAARLGDHKVATHAIEFLRELKGGDRPFFLAVGFAKPHTPFIAPKKYFMLHDAERVKLPVDFAGRPAALPGVPAIAVSPRNGDLFMDEHPTPAVAREAIAAYHAAVSFVDAQIGRVLAALDEHRLRENTIVVFFGDHGFHLGEKGKWSKHGSLYEPAARVPMIIAAPGMRGIGRTSGRTVELLDIYPTLADLAGLPIPDRIDGQSLQPLLDNPDARWSHPAYTSTRSGLEGASVRTERYRYTEWRAEKGGAELYDYETDPHELRNLANDPQHAETVATLQELLRGSPASRLLAPTRR